MNDQEFLQMLRQFKEPKFQFGQTYIFDERDFLVLKINEIRKQNPKADFLAVVEFDDPYEFFDLWDKLISGIIRTRRYSFAHGNWEKSAVLDENAWETAIYWLSDRLFDLNTRFQIPVKEWEPLFLKSVDYIKRFVKGDNMNFRDDPEFKALDEEGFREADRFRRHPKYKHRFVEPMGL